MTSSAGLLLLLLLGLSQAFPVEEDGSSEEQEEEGEEGEEEDTSDMTTGILSSNNASDEFLLQGDLLAPKTRNAMNCYNGGCLWRKNGAEVTVPYVMTRQFNRNQMGMIQRAMKAIERQTCIRFKQRSRENDYIEIRSQQGCFSALGRSGGRQMLSLNVRGCLHHGIIMHELNHALGFQHEQNRSDRDSHVSINWQNMQRQMAYNFEKQNTNNLNTPYDYNSIMHYGRTAFSINGRDTITPKRRAQIGQRQRLSRWDVERLNILYRCQ
uniref:Metalloendopeptidase n=1 Tax=Chrysiptera parasema TaxID=206155 RepID=Q8AY25_9TELE|nr:high choriolytic enzyme [Chrysiptera parasema]